MVQLGLMKMDAPEERKRRDGNVASICVDKVMRDCLNASCMMNVLPMAENDALFHATRCGELKDVFQTHVQLATDACTLLYTSPSSGKY